MRAPSDGGVCWWCSRALIRITRGQHRGQTGGEVVLIDGLPRDVHRWCAEQIREDPILRGRWEDS